VVPYIHFGFCSGGGQSVNDRLDVVHMLLIIRVDPLVIAAHHYDVGFSPFRTPCIGSSRVSLRDDRVEWLREIHVDRYIYRKARHKVQLREPPCPPLRI
jgi:hypothetical protein